MRKITRFVNRFLWKHFHFAIRIEKIAKYHPTDKVKMVYAKTAFGSVYKCWFKSDGKFISINDGNEIEFVKSYYEI